MTIADVAALAGVSQAAVSKVIRNAYGVSADMRSRVEAAIAELDYRPLLAARGLTGAPSSTLGVTVPDFANMFFTDVIRGAVDTLKGGRYQLITTPDHPDLTRGYRSIESLLDRGVDGILTISPLVEPAWLESLAQRVPVVLLGRHDPSVNYDVINGDDIAGTEMVMKHLIGLGHRRIAHFAQIDPDDEAGHLSPAIYRLETYERCMRAAGLEEHIDVMAGMYQEESAHRIVGDALRSGHNPTAIFAGNDDAALGAIRALAETDHNISVAGYDNNPLARHPLIDLTTVDQQGVRMGELAIEMLLERIGGRATPRHETLEPRLAVRRTTRAPDAEPTA